MNLNLHKIKIKLALLLICFYYLNIFEISIIRLKKIKNDILEKTNLRFLLDTKINYDTTQRKNKKDLDSIKNCEKTDYKYFVQYITGHNVTFDKEIDKSRAVSVIYNIIYY